MYGMPPLKDCHHPSIRPSVRHIRPSVRPICPSVRLIRRSVRHIRPSVRHIRPSARPIRLPSVPDQCKALNLRKHLEKKFDFARRTSLATGFAIFTVSSTVATVASFE